MSSRDKDLDATAALPRSAADPKARAARVSVVSNTALTLGKLAAGLVTGSVSVLSEALHSALDLAAAAMAYLAVRKSREPADAEHQFGHGKFESISGLAEGALILAAVALIVWGAFHRLLIPHPVVALPAVGAAVMGVSAMVNVFVSRLLFRVARETESVALEADAWHLRTDVWTSAAVLVGLAAMAVLRRAGISHAEALDPLIAMVVAVVIARAAWDIMARSWSHLVDRSLPPHEVEVIERLLAEHYPEFASYHRLRTRRAGSERYVDLHLVVEGEESVAGAHRLCDHLERDLRSLLPRTEVLIHVEPRESHG